MMNHQVVNNNSEPTTAMKDIMGRISWEDDDDDDTSRTYDDSESSHQSLHELISKSLFQIEGVMEEIMDETSFSKMQKRRSSGFLHADDDDDIATHHSRLASLQAELNHAEQEEKRNFKKAVQANVERVSNELQQTRKNEEELKDRIEKLRGQLDRRRVLSTLIVDATNVNSVPSSLKVVMAGIERISNELEETRKEEEELKSRVEKLQGQLKQRRALCNLLSNTNDEIAEPQDEDSSAPSSSEKTVMASIERISNDLDESRKNEEDLQYRIVRLRGQLEQRRALYNLIANASKIVQDQKGTTNNNKVPAFLQETRLGEYQKARQLSKEFEEHMNMKRQARAAGFSILRSPWRRQRRQETGKQERLKESEACRDADKLMLSIKSNTRDEAASFDEQRKKVEAIRRQRFEKSNSWGSFTPRSRRTLPW